MKGFLNEAITAAGSETLGNIPGSDGTSDNEQSFSVLQRSEALNTVL